MPFIVTAIMTYDLILIFLLINYLKLVCTVSNGNLVPFVSKVKVHVV